MQEGGGSGSGLMRDDTGNAIEESEQVKRLRKPSTPSAAEREEHVASGHAVYRTWCRECCVGRDRMDLHGSGGKEHDIPVIGVDYGYLNDRDVERERHGKILGHRY